MGKQDSYIVTLEKDKAECRCPYLTMDIRAVTESLLDGQRRELYLLSSRDVSFPDICINAYQGILRIPAMNELY